MTTAEFDLSKLDSGRIVDADLADTGLRREWQKHASKWATEPPFYIISHGIAQVVTGRNSDAREVLLNRDRFTAETPAGHPFGRFNFFKDLPSVISTEGVAHDRVRRLMNPFFTTGVASFEPGIAALVAELLDAIDAQGGEFDAMADFAGPLIERTLLEVMFDVEPDKRSEFTAYGRAMALVMQPTPEGDYHPEFVAQFERTTQLIRELMAARRESPREDLVTALVAAQGEGFEFSDDEIVGNILAIYAGGQNATAGSLGVLLMNLSRNPEQFQLVREDEALARDAVEESLRIHPGGLVGFPRYAVEDTEVGGTKIWKDMPVQIGIASANLDPERFPDPLRFDMRRDGKGALPFGMAGHMCIGARVARFMLNATAKGVARRYSILRLTDPDFQPAYSGGFGELTPTTIPMIAA